jgi:hypothetical protein
MTAVSVNSADWTGLAPASKSAASTPAKLDRNNGIMVYIKKVVCRKVTNTAGNKLKSY